MGAGNRRIADNSRLTYAETSKQPKRGTVKSQIHAETTTNITNSQ